jgi:hypothetical protein
MDAAPDRTSFDAALGAALRRADEERLPLGVVLAECVAPGGGRDSQRTRDVAARTRAADVIAGICRGKGEMFRLGLRRFGLVLPNFDLSETQVVGERCARTFSALAADTGFELCMGAAAYPEPGATRDALLAEAERALRQMRRATKDAAEARIAAAAGAGAFPADATSARSGFTGAQLEHMRLSYVQHRIITCPNDGTFLRAQEVHEIGRARATVIVRCPRCGLSARL